MHTFIKLNGIEVKTERFVNAPELEKGCEWYNAFDKTWFERKQVEPVDPNVNFIFGYEESEFLKKQY